MKITILVLLLINPPPTESPSATRPTVYPHVRTQKVERPKAWDEYDRKLEKRMLDEGYRHGRDISPNLQPDRLYWPGGGDTEPDPVY